MGLKITTTKHENTPVVKLVGRMIGVDDRKFQKKMESLHKKNDRIVVDISDTDFIDSHGVGIIVYYHTLMQKANKQLVLLNQNPNPVAYMTRLLEMTNLNKVLNVVTALDTLQ
jgi:anti-anti-sigma factor